jgi:hypothetical protein
VHFVQGQDSTSSDSVQLSQPPIPVEIMFGNRAIMYQMVVAKKLTDNGKLGFFNLITKLIIRKRYLKPTSFNLY